MRLWLFDLLLIYMARYLIFDRINEYLICPELTLLLKFHKIRMLIVKRYITVSTSRIGVLYTAARITIFSANEPLSKQMLATLTVNGLKGEQRVNHI